VALFLILLFIVLPIAELYVIIKVGGAIGILPTLALLIVDSIVGAMLARSQGRLAWLRFNQALADGRVPAREVFDGAMIILGGAFLLTPGFITDLIGLFLLVPPTRALFRHTMARLARRRFVFTARAARWGGPGAGGPRYGSPPTARPYDVEGTAREVTDPPDELERGERG
jgi:UPF0716 protein FxsA